MIILKDEKGTCFSHVPLLLVAGLEPARGCPRGILSPLRLPIPPHQRTLFGLGRVARADSETAFPRSRRTRLCRNA